MRARPGALFGSSTALIVLTAGLAAAQYPPLQPQPQPPLQPQPQPYPGSCSHASALPTAASRATLPAAVPSRARAALPAALPSGAGAALPAAIPSRNGTALPATVSAALRAAAATVPVRLPPAAADAPADEQVPELRRDGLPLRRRRHVRRRHGHLDRLAREDRATRASRSSRPSSSRRPSHRRLHLGQQLHARSRGVPSSIATGLLLGGIEGIAISGLQWQFTGNGGPSTWQFSTETTVTFLTATAGGIGGFFFGEWLQPDPRSLALIASGAGWGTLAGVMFGSGVGRRGQGLDGRHGRVGLRRATTSGWWGQGRSATVYTPSWQSLKYMWAGDILGHARDDARLPLLHRQQRHSSPRAHRELPGRPRGPRHRRRADGEHDRPRGRGLVDAAFRAVGRPDEGRSAAHGLRPVVSAADLPIPQTTSGAFESKAPLVVQAALARRLLGARGRGRRRRRGR